MLLIYYGYSALCIIDLAKLQYVVYYRLIIVYVIDFGKSAFYIVGRKLIDSFELFSRQLFVISAINSSETFRDISRCDLTVLRNCWTISCVFKVG